jgi:integrase
MLSLPATLSDAVTLYIQSQGQTIKPKAIRNLRTTLKKTILPNFQFSENALTNLDSCLAKVSIRDFVLYAKLYFEAFYQKALAEGKNEDTLRNYRSCLTRLLNWMDEQLWYQQVVQVTAIPDRAPRLKSPANLQRDHRGRRKSGEYPYALKEGELTPKLAAQLESIQEFLTAKYMPARKGEPALRERSFKCRREHILYFLGWLHHDTSRTFKHLSCPLDKSKKTLEDLDITLMIYRETLEKYIGWHLTTKGNGYGFCVQIGAAALAIAKWNFSVNEAAPRQARFDDCRDVLNVRAVMSELKPESKKDRRTTSREALSEKLLEMEQCQEIVEYLRRCCAERTAQGHKRSNTRIIDSWQDYLICSILTYTPVRQREIRELELGKTLIREADGWWVKLSPSQHKTGSKTGKGREYPLFPCHLKERFNKDLDDYINKWRALENLDHNFLFFIRGTDAQKRQGRGEPIHQANHLSRLIPKLIFKITGILYGLENAKATTPHDFRRIFETWLFKYGTPEDIEIYTEILGHSPEEARKTYQQVTSREKTERAEFIFQKVTKQAENIRRQKSNPKRRVLEPNSVDISKLLTILTPEQKKELGLL